MAIAKIIAKKNTGAHPSRKPCGSKRSRLAPTPSWKIRRATPNAAAVESRLVKVPSAAINGACKGDEQQHEPGDQDDADDPWRALVEQRLEVEVLDCRAAHHCRRRKLGAESVHGVGERGVGRVDSGNGLHHRPVGAVGGRRRRRDSGDPAVMRRASRCNGVGVVAGDDDLQGARGAVTERVLDHVVALARVGVLWQDGDRRHRGLQARRSARQAR